LTAKMAQKLSRKEGFDVKFVVDRQGTKKENAKPPFLALSPSLTAHQQLVISFYEKVPFQPTSGFMRSLLLALLRSGPREFEPLTVFGPRALLRPMRFCVRTFHALSRAEQTFAAEMPSASLSVSLRPARRASADCNYGFKRKQKGLARPGETAEPPALGTRGDDASFCLSLWRQFYAEQ